MKGYCVAQMVIADDARGRVRISPTDVSQFIRLDQG
jgi:hypothetical protein